MSRTQGVAGRTVRRRRRGRVSPVPRPPRWHRSEWKILDEQHAALGIVLWQVLRDVLLWTEADAGERKLLFRQPGGIREERLARAAGEAPELADSLRELALVSESPSSAEPTRTAAACEGVWMWAELRGMRETALQFAETAAKVEPEVSSRSYTAGRLCRSAAEYERAIVWFRRAERLGRLADSNIDVANAHLGWGTLEHDRGNLANAEWHFSKAHNAAIRNGRKSLAAMACHNLLGVAIDADQFERAVKYAAQATELYPAKHPRIPFLAHDIGSLWMRAGYFSTSIYLFRAVLPWIEQNPLPGLASFARAAAAVRDRVGYERLAEQVLRVAVAEKERADAALYHLAEGARSFEQWDRAEQFASQALRYAQARENKDVIRLAEHLLMKLADRTLGDVDTVPHQGGVVDRITAQILRKLRRQPAPESLNPGTVLFPERYPTD